MKQLKFRHLNTDSKNSLKQYFFPERGKNGSEKAITILFSILRSFRPFYDKSRLFQKISKGYRRFPKTKEEVRPLPKMFEEPSKHLTVISSKIVNIKKLAN